MKELNRTEEGGNGMNKKLSQDEIIRFIEQYKEENLSEEQVRQLLEKVRRETEENDQIDKERLSDEILNWLRGK